MNYGVKVSNTATYQPLWCQLRTRKVDGLVSQPINIYGLETLLRYHKVKYVSGDI